MKDDELYKINSVEIKGNEIHMNIQVRPALDFIIVDLYLEKNKKNFLKKLLSSWKNKVKKIFKKSSL